MRIGLHAARDSARARTLDGAKPRPPARFERRIVGPIWLNGEMKTDVWIGDPADPPADAPRLDARDAARHGDRTGGDTLAAVTLIVV